ncbi:MAG: hypothetical protein K5755_03040 [Clostridiales bacterium]|nr:hypothetical protein [Clostridia bacterium]MCR4563592.1 hypothetical protein [Clostridiales bacterium]
MTLDRLFDKFGRSVRVTSVDESWQGDLYRAFIQPLRYKNKMYLEDKRVPLGIGDMSYYLYLGPASFDLTTVDEDEYMLKSGNEKFFITRAEKLYFSDSVCYIWAVIKRFKEEELC